MRAALVYLRERSPEELARLMTAILVIATPFSLRFDDGAEEKYNILIGMIGAAMLLAPPLLRSAGAWLCLFALMAIGVAGAWEVTDNNRYLILYWTLACALSATSERSERFLAWNGRILIGLTFASAVLWKLRAGDYPDGHFFHHMFLTDERLVGVAALGGLDRVALADNQTLLELLYAHPAQSLSLELASTPRLAAIATAASYWTLFIEGLIAFTFLCKSRFRNFALMVFLCSTYLIAPVPLFASTLAILAVSQCEPLEARQRLCLVALFLLVQLSALSFRMSSLVATALG